MKKWQTELQKQYDKQTGGDFKLDKDSATLITETSLYWLVRYDEGQAEFINLIYKPNETAMDMQTIEV
jgi:hypothetical protein